ncbi:hypothetical protein CGRA01v4_12015 [Colletotrichum graminicola]|nr:hypothetical protein CGRA01v4_12015 [Colletotrichum graminicola]
MVEHPANGPSDVPYDVVRKKHLFTPHELQKFIEQEESDKFGGDWEKVPTPRTMALTQRDFKEKDGLPPSGWPQESPGNHQLPTVQELWRFFHLTYFGEMLDANEGAYGWANNVKNKNRENPDLYAIIGAVIELMHRDGQRYSVSAEGEIMPIST